MTILEDVRRGALIIFWGAAVTALDIVISAACGLKKNALSKLWAAEDEK